MKVEEKGIITGIDCNVYIVPETSKGSLQFSSCNLEPGFHKICSINMNQLRFSIERGKWFCMKDFDFSNPEVGRIDSEYNLYKDYSYYVGTEITCGRMPLKFSPWLCKRKEENENRT